MTNLLVEDQLIVCFSVVDPQHPPLKFHPWITSAARISPLSLHYVHMNCDVIMLYLL